MKDLVEFGRKLGITLAKECIPFAFFLDLTLPFKEAIIYIKIINLIIISVQFGDAFFLLPSITSLISLGVVY
jgi:hypothetical protein